VPEDQEVFAGAVGQVLTDGDLARKLAAGAREAALPAAAMTLGAQLVALYRRAADGGS
jgi:hypothetical protein